MLPVVETTVLEVLTCYHDNADDCACRKPRPGLLLEAARRYGLDLRHSVMVGDSEPDVEVARATGVMAVLVAHGYANGPYEELGADAVIDGFADLVGLLDRWWCP